MAAKCYRRSAEQTNYVAMKSLGYLLSNGLGVNQDLEAARYWLTRAAEEGGNRRAMYNLGVLCDIRHRYTKTTAEAFQWFKKSADLGDALACAALAQFYLRVRPDLDSYHYWRLKAATLGATEAQYAMGIAYWRGDGVPKDVESSLGWYRKAAAKNHPEALYNLACHYSEEKTNRLSMALAKEYMLRAALAGNREAQFENAMSCFRGDFAEHDFEGGKHWLARAAENGWARAEFCLFQLYYNGIPPVRGCPPYPKNAAEAIRWLRRAAAHENLQAQAVLAVMLTKGTDMEQNKAEAEKLLRNAAEHGYAPAQNDLGFSILNDDASKADLVEAAMWCRLAESRAADPNVSRTAKVNLSNALSRLTADQQLDVERRAKNFQALPVAEPFPMSEDWEKNPAYKQEDGRFGH